MNTGTQNHEKKFPTARMIRRTCNKELYRAAKRLTTYISEDKMKKAEDLYYKKVVLHLIYIHEHRSNRKLLSDWWDEHVAADIAAIWQVPQAELSRSFRDAFGG